jgi:hypothetical protein
VNRQFDSGGLIRTGAVRGWGLLLHWRRDVRTPRMTL